MIADESLQRLMAMLSGLVQDVEALKESKESFARMILHLGEAGQSLSERVDLLQAEVERLAGKVYTKKRKPRSDRGKKRVKKGEKK